MKQALIAALLMLSLAACASHEPPTPEGAVFQLNPGRWMASADDLVWRKAE